MGKSKPVNFEKQFVIDGFTYNQIQNIYPTLWKKYDIKELKEKETTNVKENFADPGATSHPGWTCTLCGYDRIDFTSGHNYCPGCGRQLAGVSMGL